MILSSSIMFYDNYWDDESKYSHAYQSCGKGAFSAYSARYSKSLSAGRLSYKISWAYEMIYSSLGWYEGLFSFNGVNLAESYDIKDIFFLL